MIFPKETYTELAEIAAQQGFSLSELMAKLSEHSIQANSQALQVRGNCEK